jgi:uncharacterized damage-inducible protein DinB
MGRSFYLERCPSVREGLLAVVDAFQAEDLALTPVKGGWPVGRIILHISSAANYWLHSGILSSINVVQPGESIPINYPMVAAIKTFLAEGHERTIDLLENFKEENWNKNFNYPDGTAYQSSWVFWHVLEHEIHHRGELSLVLGQIG